MTDKGKNMSCFSCFGDHFRCCAPAQIGRIGALDCQLCLIVDRVAGEFSAVCLVKGCGKSYTGITKKNARQNLSEHIKRVHKLSLVEYRREYEAPEAMAQREAVQQRREARRESAWRGPDEPLGGDLNFDDFLGGDMPTPPEPEAPQASESSSESEEADMTLIQLFYDKSFEQLVCENEAVIMADRQRAQGKSIEPDTRRTMLYSLRSRIKSLLRVPADKLPSRFVKGDVQSVEFLAAFGKALKEDVVPLEQWVDKLDSVSAGQLDKFWTLLKDILAFVDDSWTAKLLASQLQLSVPPAALAYVRKVRQFAKRTENPHRLRSNRARMA